MASRDKQKFLEGKSYRVKKRNIKGFLKKILPVLCAGLVIILSQLVLFKVMDPRDNPILTSLEGFLFMFFFYAMIMAITWEDEDDVKEEYEELKKKYQAKVDETAKTKQDILEYFLLWVHQIKTPIAAAKLLTEKREDVELRSQIVSIEKYTDMAISYLKLASGDAEIYPEKVDLDRLLRGLLKKYAIIFISNNIELEYSLEKKIVVTDGKWLSLALEQILSNAGKYAENAKVYIRFREDDNSLVIGDTGIGIAAEDLPKIFDKGYSGFNGQNNDKSTGIGLYLTKSILDRLNLPINVKSQVGSGTEFSIKFPRETDYK